MNDFDFLRRFFVIIIAVLQPFIINFYLGDMPSISSVWGTPLQPLFIIVNAMVSYLFFEMPKWRIPAFLLLFLTAFSVTEYPIFHTVLAVLFFIGCVYGINSIKRFRWYLIPYAISTIFLISGLYWFETWSIVILCIYHLDLLFYKYILLRRK